MKEYLLNRPKGVLDSYQVCKGVIVEFIITERGIPKLEQCRRDQIIMLKYMHHITIGIP